MNTDFRTTLTVAGTALLAASVCVISPVRAQTDDGLTEQDRTELDRVVITANRIEQAAVDVPARVSVITRADIERSQAPDLLELLRLEAGVDITRSGPPGSQTSVFLRGSNSNHVLVLIDGVRVAASGTGAFTWEFLDPALIQRIEIVRGPRAARWGSDAIGGVIQIFTLRPDATAARVRVGTDSDYAGSVAWGNHQADPATGTVLDFALSGRTTDGFSAQNANGFAFDPDDDGFENINLSTGGGVAVGSGRLNWRGRLATGENEFDQGVTDFINSSARLEYLHQSGGHWQWQASAGVLYDELDTANAFGGSLVETTRYQADWLAERSLGADAAWLIGVDGWLEDGMSRGSWSEDRYNVGLFTGLDGQRGALGYEVSVRLDDNEFYSTELSGNLGLNYRISEQFRSFVTVGRGYKAPTFSQLFSPGFQFAPGGDFFFAGNPDLNPERSWSGEFGFDWTPSRAHRFYTSVYGNWIEDLIDFSGANSQAINISE
ncbi:MAG: TonB-dependent receptor, partial [Pseudomonadota bacterium]